MKGRVRGETELPSTISLSKSWQWLKLGWSESRSFFGFPIVGAAVQAVGPCSVAFSGYWVRTGLEVEPSGQRAPLWDAGTAGGGLVRMSRHLPLLTNFKWGEITWTAWLFSKLILGPSGVA